MYGEIECSIMRHMETIIKRVKKGQLDKDSIEMAGAILKKGGLVAFPTETVYGLGADALNPEAVGKVYAAKGRPSDNPMIVHISSKDDMIKLTYEITADIQKLMNALWPGPLTMVVPARDYSKSNDRRTGYSSYQNAEGADCVRADTNFADPTCGAKCKPFGQAKSDIVQARC
mgnify:CR=1 FL=1